MNIVDLEQLKKGDEVFYEGNFLEVAEVKKFPHGKMIGIYDEKPFTNHIDYLNPQNLIKVFPCNNCQGGGCPTCSGSGKIII